MWRTSKARSCVSRLMALAWIALCAVTLVGGPRIEAADEVRTWILKSGLHTFAPEHVVRATVSEVGRAISTRVHIELRNRRHELVAEVDGELTPTSPVQLDYTTPPAELAQLSTTIKIVRRNLLTTTSPVAVLEEIDPLNLTIEPRIQCAREGPPSGRDTGQTFNCVDPCPGWSVTTFVARE